MTVRFLFVFQAMVTAFLGNGLEADIFPADTWSPVCTLT